MYRLFYTPSTAKDILYVVIDPSVFPNEIKTDGDVVAMYSQGNLVGINILNASSHFSLSSSGMIPAPSSTLLVQINELLTNAGVEPLCKQDSLFKVANLTLKEEHPTDEKLSIVTFDIGNNQKATTLSRHKNLEVGNNYVVCLDGCIKGDGTVFTSHILKGIEVTCEVCSPKELLLGEEDKLAYIESSKTAGSDFFGE